MTAVPLVLIGAVLLGGCTTDTPVGSDARLAGASSDPTNGSDGVSTLPAPAVTAPQATRIVARIAEAVAKADEAGDAELAATRLDGPALQLRTTGYAIRKFVTDKKDSPVLPAIPTGNLSVTLPQQSEGWPRTVFVVVEDEADPAVLPLALMLIQDNPRAQYKVHYAIALQPGAVVPSVAGANLGASRVDENVKLFIMAPAEIAAAYGDILMNDSDSEYYDLFESEGDAFRVAVGKQFKADRVAKTPKTAKLTFENLPGEGQVIAMATVDGGVLVALELDETETITPTETGAAVNAPPQVAALLGKSSSIKGLTATYGDQLLFFLPSATSGDKIVLLGYAQGLIKAVEGK